MSGIVGAVKLNPIAQRILDRRLEIGYSTQQEAANAADIGTTTWGLMESKGRLPKTQRVRQRISRVLRWPSTALDNLAAGLDPEAIGLPEPVVPQEILARRLEELAEAIARGHDTERQRIEAIHDLQARLEHVEYILQTQQGRGQGQ